MHLLNLPSHGTLLLCAVRVVLRQLVDHDILRALGREHQPEQPQSMAFGKVFHVNQLAVSLFVRIP
jgi:hypothetical protein